MLGMYGLGTQELIIAGVVLVVLVFAPFLFAFARAGFRHPLLTAIPVSITVFLVVALAAGFTGMNALAILAIIAIAAIVYGFSRTVIRTSDNKSDAASRKTPSTAHEASASYEVQQTELRKAEVDIVTEKNFLIHEIKRLEAENDAPTARFGEQSSSLRPLGNLTCKEASRYFTESCELLERGCGMREKEPLFPLDAPDNYSLEEDAMAKQPGKANDVLRWLCVLPGGIFASFLILFPLHWVLYFTLVRGGMIQMPMEDMAPIERFLSPVLSSIVFVFVGAMIAPKQQVRVSYVLFSLSLFARIGMLVVAIAQQLDVDLSTYGISRLLISSLAGALGIFLVTLKTKQEIDSSESPSMSSAAQPQRPATEVVIKSETKEATKDLLSPLAPKSFMRHADPVFARRRDAYEARLKIFLIGLCMVTAGIMVLIAVMSGTDHTEQTSLKKDRFTKQVETGKPPVGFSPETFEQLKNFAKERFEGLPGVKEHQRKSEQLIADRVAAHQGQPFPEQHVMSRWIQEIRAELLRELVASPEFQAVLDRMTHFKEPEGSEFLKEFAAAEHQLEIQGELERLAEQWALSRMDARKLLNEFSRKYQRWLKDQASSLRPRNQRNELAYKQNDDLALREVEAAFSSISKSTANSQDSPKRIESTDTSPTSKGTAGEMEKFMKEFMNQMVSQNKQYRAELDKIGWNQILDPKRLARDTSLAKSKDTIRKAKEIVDKYTEQMNLLLAMARNDINALNLSAVEKAKAKQAFESGIRESRQLWNQIWQLERDIVSKFGEIIDFLHRDYGNWSVSDGQLFFSTDDTVAAYEKYLGSIRNLVAQQKQLWRDGAQNVQADVNHLRPNLGP